MFADSRCRRLWSVAFTVAACLLVASVVGATETWDTTGSVGGERGDHTATLLNDGQVLVAGGDDAGALSTSELFDAATGSWVATAGGLGDARSAHTATLLSDGRVLAVGGVDGSALSSSELFDPATKTWSATDSLIRTRSGHTATLLKDGRVLVVGGENAATLRFCEVYDPATGNWAATGNLASARSGHTATLLPDGRVLVVGGTGAGGGILASVEFYDPATGLWAVTGSLGSARTGHTATRLANSRILVVGGANGAALSTAEVYSVATGLWSATGSLGTARTNHSVSLLPDGRVLTIGGRSLGALASSETYDPGSGDWTPTPVSPTAQRSAHTATILGSGRVLAVGGFNTGLAAIDDAEIYDPAVPVVSTTGGLPLGRRQARMSVLGDGRMLISGGNRESVASTALFNPDTMTWATTDAMDGARRLHASNLLPDGTVLVAGGTDELGFSTDGAERYDPATSLWSATDSMNSPRQLPGSTSLADGRVLITGGADNAGEGNPFVDLDTTDIYDPDTGLFSSSGTLLTARTSPLIALLLDGRVLAVAGTLDDDSLDSAELWDPGSGTWSATGSMADSRTLTAGTLLADGRFLVAGGATQDLEGSLVVLAEAEIYDPATGLWSSTGAMSTSRIEHTLTLLPDGRVLVTGGFDGAFAPSSSLEIFDPAGNGGAGSFSSAGKMSVARAQHTAEVLADGRVLIAGGTDSLSLPDLLGLDRRGVRTRPGSVISALRIAPLAPLSSTEVFDIGLGYAANARPLISGATSSLGDGQPLVIEGSGFRGVGESSGGNGGQSSPSDYPVVQIRTIDSEQIRYVGPDPSVGWSDTGYTSEVVAGLPTGYYRVTVFANGIPSISTFGLRDSFGQLTDLSITKTDGQVEVEPGDPLTYTLVGGNAGPTAVFVAQISDILPASLENCSWTCTGESGGLCTASGNGNVIDSANLPVAATVTYTIDCDVASTFQGSITNTATIASSITDSLIANNTAVDQTTSACTLLELAMEDLDSTETFSCQTVSAGDGLRIIPPGDITFAVTGSALFSDGFTVLQGGSLTVRKSLGGAPDSQP